MGLPDLEGRKELGGEGNWGCEARSWVSGSMVGLRSLEGGIGR